MCTKVSDWRGLCLRTSAKWADFVAQSLHWKLPFPTQVRDWFDDWVVGSQFDIYCLHHPVRPNHAIGGALQKGRLCGHIRPHNSRSSVSVEVGGLLSRFWSRSLRSSK